jgi:hypothetical protein
MENNAIENSLKLQRHIFPQFFGEFIMDAEKKIPEHNVRSFIVFTLCLSIIWRSVLNKACSCFHKLWLKFTGQTIEQTIYTKTFDKQMAFEWAVINKTVHI